MALALCSIKDKINGLVLGVPSRSLNVRESLRIELCSSLPCGCKIHIHEYISLYCISKNSIVVMDGYTQYFQILGCLGLPGLEFDEM